MKGRFFDVVAYIAQRYGAEGGTAQDPLDLREELLDAGYHEDDVERALSWLDQLPSNRVRVSSRGPGGGREVHRVPSTEEAVKLTPDARSYLLRLERSGVLDEATREVVYERALSVDLPELDVDEVRLLVALLFEANPAVDDRLATYVLKDELDLAYH